MSVLLFFSSITLIVDMINHSLPLEIPDTLCYDQHFSIACETNNKESDCRFRSSKEGIWKIGRIKHRPDAKQSDDDPDRGGVSQTLSRQAAQERELSTSRVTS